MNCKFIFVASLSLLLLPSCLKDDPSNEVTVSYPTTNLVIPDNPAESPVVKSATYTLRCDLNNAKMVVSSSDLDLGNGALSFTTGSIPYRSWSSSMGDVNMLAGLGSSTGSVAVSDLQGSISAAVYHPSLSFGYDNVPDVPSVSFLPNQLYTPKIVFQYKVPGYTVKTFSRDETFYGSSKVYYGAGLTYEPEKNEHVMLYRLVFSSSFKTADLVIYNAKFTPDQEKPIPALVLKNLDVTFSSRGYNVAWGANSRSSYKDESGNYVTAVDDWTFSSFQLQSTSADLVSVSIDYTVKLPGVGSARGEFSGIYCITSFES